jgi:hypothetical protein
MTNLFERRILEYLHANSSLRWASRTEFPDLTYDKYEKIVVDDGLPLVVSHVTRDWNNRSFIFTPAWLKQNFGNMPLIRSPRDVKKFEDLQGWTLGQYIEYIYRYHSSLNFGVLRVALKMLRHLCLFLLSSILKKPNVL